MVSLAQGGDGATLGFMATELCISRETLHLPCFSERGGWFFSLIVHLALLWLVSSLVWTPPVQDDTLDKVIEITLSPYPDLSPQQTGPAPAAPAAAPPLAQVKPRAALPPQRPLVTRPPTPALPVAAASDVLAPSAPDAGAAASNSAPTRTIAEPSPAQREMAVSGYASQVLSAVERYKTYPALSVSRGEEDTITVHLLISARGELLDLTATSGTHHRLIEASLAAVRAAAPFPAFPAELGGVQLAFNLPVVYRLR